jgi:hypothetical protein
MSRKQAQGQRDCEQGDREQACQQRPLHQET